ncbi:BatA domain-containing protein [Namhaeicola litoreus]|uniref:BatA domain-containing protein n=1 Tax=Namhaeicola litoreus TaxID=1052145 RepID=A0ABW3Y5W4_9FLAO
MLFRNPALLFGLFLLLIPIILHFFNLQRFETVKFTNVKFLKAIKEKSQKRSKLKKWLLLITRLLALTCLILAFAQPYFPSEKNAIPEVDIIYIDNSLSMKAKGPSGEFFSQAKQTLYENLKGKEVYLITNEGVEKENFTNDKILDLDYSTRSSNEEQLNLHIDQIETNKEVQKNIIILSDLQSFTFDSDLINTSNSYHLVELIPVNIGNAFVDSIWTTSESPDNLQLTARVYNALSEKEDINVTLWINDEIQGKRVANVKENSFEDISFTVKSIDNFSGKITLEDGRLDFDNDFYFSFPLKEKLKVLSLGNKTDYLKKIYHQKEFDFDEITLNNWEATNAKNYDLIILNELEFIPAYLREVLSNYLYNGGNIALIPNENIDQPTYNQLLNQLNIGSFRDTISRELKITEINYDDPFFKNVFKKREENFSYPSTQISFQNSLRNSISLMKYENGSPFLAKSNVGNGMIFIFTSPLSSEKSNLTSSTLIVPLFYNFTIRNHTQNNIYYRIGQQNEISIKNPIKSDEVYHLAKDDFDYIPLQKSQNEELVLTTNELPNKAGIYSVRQKDVASLEIAYNFPKSESYFRKIDFSELEKNNQNITVSKDLNEALSLMKAKGQDKNLWQLFITFVLVLLIAEMLIQKFVKN